MPNPFHEITKVFKDHFTCDDKDIYIQTLRLIDHCATELDGYDYETNSDGEEILNELKEDVKDYEKSQIEDDEVDGEVDEDDAPERNLEDLDEDEPVVDKESGKLIEPAPEGTVT